MRIFKYLKMRLFCKHSFKSVENSPIYFHYKCENCGHEKGMGNFKIK